MPLPPQPLSHEQRQRICALLALGATRRMAVRFAGCRVLDLKVELRRDPLFKQQVREHELRPEIEVLRAMLGAAREPKEWRAAAWVLERLYPRRYAARKANAVMPAAMKSTVEHWAGEFDAAKLDPRARRQSAKPRRKAAMPRAKSGQHEPLEDRETSS